MMQRLRFWLHQTRLTLREWAFMVRTWIWDWAEVARTPFRFVRSLRTADMVEEVRFGGHQFLGLVGGFFRILFGLLAGLFFFIVFLPLNLYWLVVHGPRRAWVTLRSYPPRLIGIVVGVTCFVIVGLGATAGYVWWEKRTEFRRGIYNRQLEHYLQFSDIDQVEQALASLLELSPRDRQLATRLEAVRQLEAPVGDPKLLRVTMRTHMRQSDYAKAAREAAKLLEDTPYDWEARCVLADEAHQRNDTEGVRKHLTALPKALEVDIAPGVACYSAALFQRLGETARFDDMIEYLVLNVLQHLRNRDLVNFDHDAKLLFLECYRLCLTQLDRRPRLTQYWIPVQSLCRSVIASDTAEARHLMGVAHSQQLHLDFLQEFLRRRLMTKDECEAMNKEIESRIRQASERVLALDPKTTQAYILLAEHQYRTGQSQAALDTINGGLKACGGAPELVADKALLLRRIDPLAGLAFLDRTVRIDTLTPPMCQVYADAARAAGRPDKALEACKQAQKQQPGLLWAHRLEAQICMDQGRPTRAAAALLPIKSFLATDPMGCELYVRALCECGSFKVAEEFLDQVAADNRPVSVLLKAAKAFELAGRLDDAVRWAKISLDRDPTNATALLLVADNTRVLAERGDRDWDRDRVRESLRCYRSVQRQQPGNLAIVNNIAWLELKALELPAQALESAGPLRAVQNSVTLPAEFLETLGAVYLANGQFDEARKMLNHAIATAGPRASFYTHLALAHHGLQQPEMASKCIDKAVELPKSPREFAFLIDTARLMQQKK